MNNSFFFKCMMQEAETTLYLHRLINNVTERKYLVLFLVQPDFEIHEIHSPYMYFVS